MLWPFPFNHYPGTDYETFNWDWLIRTGKRMEQVISDLFSDTGALHQMVDKVLDEHPEWTTTVMDGAISTAKLMDSAVVTDKIANGAVNKIKLGDDITNYLPLEYTKTRYTGDAGTTSVWYSIIPKDYKPALRLANDAVNTFEDMSGIAERNHATITINAGVFDTDAQVTRGYVITDSEVKQATYYDSGYNNYYVYMDRNGVLKSAIETTPLNVILQDDPIWCCHAFHLVVDNGTLQPISDASVNPRTFIGQNAAGDYLVATTAGRADTEAGFTVKDIYDFTISVGFSPKFLINLDGGGSVNFNYKGYRQNTLINGENRKIANAITFEIPVVKAEDTFEVAASGNSANNTIQEYIQNEIVNKRLYPLRFGEQIAAGTDLNTITMPGRYAANSNAIATSLSNCPTTKAFSMVVENVFSYYNEQGVSNDLIRTIQPYDEEYAHKQLIYSDANGVYTYRDWYKIDVPPAQHTLTKVGNFDQGNPRYDRAGNVVRVYGDFRSLGIANNDVLDSGLPAPIASNPEMDGLIVSFSGTCYKCCVNTNGQLVAKAAIPNGTYCFVMLTYITKE